MKLHCLSSLDHDHSSSHLAKPGVSLGVGGDALYCHDALVDHGLQPPQVLDVEQSQYLGRLVHIIITSIKAKTRVSP